MRHLWIIVLVLRTMFTVRVMSVLITYITMRPCFTSRTMLIDSLRMSLRAVLVLFSMNGCDCNTWTTEHVSNTCDEQDDSEGEEWCQQDQIRILIQSHNTHHFIISISPT